MAKPELDTQASHLRAGDRVWRYGQWHDIAHVQAGAFGQSIYVVTDDDPPRTFHIDAALFVAAECLPRTAS